MRVLLVLSDTSGCGHYRMVLPGKYACHECDKVLITEGLPGKLSADCTRMIVDPSQIDVDVMVLQRPVLDVVADCIPVAQAQGITVVVDIDDDLHSLDPQNQAYETLHPRLSPHANWNHLARACKHADLITVTTEALAQRYASHGRVAVIPNMVEQDLLHINGPTDENIVGWSGVIGTHPNDLQVTQGNIAQVLRETETQFRVVGEKLGVKKALSLDDEPEETGWLPIEMYHRELYKLTVGIVPLANSKFNEAKSNLKGLEYAALGVPFIASPLPEYVKLSEEGIGLLAIKGKKWKTNLISCLQDESLKEEIALAGVEGVAENHLINDNYYLWLEAWEKALKYRRKG